MVIRIHKRRNRGFFFVDLALGLFLLAFAVLPLAFSFSHEQKLLRSCYYRALATEIVDGEFERLRAGEWRAFSEGEHAYNPVAGARTNLPAGNFLLTLRGTTVRLEWVPEQKNRGGKVVREGEI